ncbi:TetR/AcrR family transcriptional regulator [Mycobacterium sp. SMC-11]|uniref:TetR/AcrR family transcriptional regulator n=1 Tax=Mycobacterium sp. SMC-11 TaxID=3385969 RepID=UPI00390CA092
MEVVTGAQNPRRRRHLEAIQWDRQRILDAMAESIAAVGYANTTVADVARRAQTSLRTFYRFFADREAALVALIAATNDDVIAHTAAAVDPHADWQTQIRQAVTAWIECSESRPALIVSWIRDVPALGAGCRDLQAQSMDAYIAMIQALSSTKALHDAGIRPVSRTRAIILIGGINELTATTVEHGERLSDLTEDIIDATIALLNPVAESAD